MPHTAAVPPQEVRRGAAGHTSGLMTTGRRRWLEYFPLRGFIRHLPGTGQAGKHTGLYYRQLHFEFLYRRWCDAGYQHGEMLAASFVLALIPGKALEGLSRVMEREWGGMAGPVPYEAKAQEFISVGLRAGRCIQPAVRHLRRCVLQRGLPGRFRLEQIV